MKHAKLNGPIPRPMAERLAAMVTVDPLTGCHNVRAGTHGYGGISEGGGAGRYLRAHRASYELAKGPIPQGLVIDHLCRNKACINPDHLEAVTQRENTLRGVGPSALAALKTHCMRGHPFDEANTSINTRGHRVCRKCRAEIDRRYQGAVRSVLAREDHLKPTPTDREAGELLGISDWAWFAGSALAAVCWLALILQGAI